jgi:osmotically-inducible protein OsmY
MKRILISALALFLTSSAVWAQNKNARPAKTKPAVVDCAANTDAQITENVKARFAATATLKDQAINVATSGGVVTLTGSVKGNHKGLATLQARRAPCVKRVDNQITMEGAAPKNKNSKRKTSNKNM